MKLISILFFLFSQICFSASTGDWKLGIGLGISPNYLVTLTGSGVSAGSPYVRTYNLEYSSATSIAFDFRKLSTNSWGMLGGFEYEAERSITKSMVNFLPVSTSGDTSKFQTSFLHYGAAYRWDIFYIPFGLAYGFTKFIPDDNTLGTATASNGLGGYFGFGWYINDKFVIEYVSRSTLTTLTFANGANTESTTGAIGSALLGVKYFF